MKKQLFVVCVVFALVALTGCQGTPPDEVALQLAQATNKQDLEGALTLFADDAVVDTGGPAPFNGKAEIQGWLEMMFAGDFKLEAEIVEVKGNVVTEHDTMTSTEWKFLGIAPLEGTSEITVEGGKIKTLIFTFSDDSLTKLTSVDYITQEDLLGEWRLADKYIVFREDGTMRVANRPEDLPVPLDEAHPGAIEAWSYDGTVLTMQDTDPPQFVAWEFASEVECGAGTYLVKWGDDGRIKFRAIEEPCASRMVAFEMAGLAPLSP